MYYIYSIYVQLFILHIVNWFSRNGAIFQEVKNSIAASKCHPTTWTGGNIRTRHTALQRLVFWASWNIFTLGEYICSLHVLLVYVRFDSFQFNFYDFVFPFNLHVPMIFHPMKVTRTRTRNLWNYFWTELDLVNLYGETYRAIATAFNRFRTAINFFCSIKTEQRRLCASISHFPANFRDIRLVCAEFRERHRTN